MSIEFLLTSLIVIATPGTGVLYTVTAGLSRGSRASIVAAFGCTLGIVPHMLAALTGLAALMHASALAFQVVKWAGVAYLVYLGWTTWRDRSPVEVSHDAPPRARTVITQAILINLLNPKLTIFFFAFLPQFVKPDESLAIVKMLGLSSVFMLLTFVVFVVYGAFAATVRSHVVSRPRVVTWMRRTFAAAFVGLAARLAFADR